MIQPLGADPEGIQQNTSNSIVFTAIVAHYSVAPTEISLHRINGDENIVVGKMRDDGLGADLQGNDGVYTAMILLTEPNEGTIPFSASGFFPGVSGERFSAPFVLRVTCHSNRMRSVDMSKVVTDSTTGKSFPSNEVLVTFKEPSTCAERNEIAALVGGTIVGTSPGTGIYQIGIPAGTTVNHVYDAISTLQKQVEVLSANPNLFGARASTSESSSATPSIPTSNKSYKIVFVSLREKNRDIFIMDADGSNVSNLTNNPGSNAFPVVSPDGTMIAFRAMEPDGARELYLINTDGSNMRRLTVNNDIEWNHVWSPDSKWIAFQAGSLYIIGADGSNLKKLIEDRAGSSPAWAPDGTKIAFVSGRDGTGVYVMYVDGTQIKRITNTKGVTGSPKWTPDSRQIIFQGNQEDNNEEIFVVNADGTNLKNVTNDPAIDGAPSVSPDGKKIAFLSSRDNSSDIYVMNIDGSNINRFSGTLADYDEEESLQWSSDSKQIIFVSRKDGNKEIYIVNADGTGLENLTNNPAMDIEPYWFYLH